MTGRAHTTQTSLVDTCFWVCFPGLRLFSGFLVAVLVVSGCVCVWACACVLRVASVCPCGLCWWLPCVLWCVGLGGPGVGWPSGRSLLSSPAFSWRSFFFGIFRGLFISQDTHWCSDGSLLDVRGTDLPRTNGDSASEVQNLHAERPSNVAQPIARVDGHSSSSELSAHQMGPHRHWEVSVIRDSFALVPSFSARSLTCVWFHRFLRRRQGRSTGTRAHSGSGCAQVRASTMSTRMSLHGTVATESSLRPYSSRSTRQWKVSPRHSGKRARFSLRPRTELMLSPGHTGSPSLICQQIGRAS